MARSHAVPYTLRFSFFFFFFFRGARGGGWGRWGGEGGFGGVLGGGGWGGGGGWEHPFLVASMLGSIHVANCRPKAFGLAFSVTKLNTSSTQHPKPLALSPEPLPLNS